MILTISHVTRYRFETPRRALVQSLRLRPANSEGQSVQAWDIACHGATFSQTFRDGAGDELQTATVIGPVSEVEIAVTGRVMTRDTLGVLKGHREICPPMAYLRDTKITAPSHEIRALSDEVVGATDEGDLLGRAHALARAVSDAVAYVPGETHAATTATEALVLGKGVCQDHAHVLIAAALAADMPARYVTGYLFTGTDDVMGEASHAWAELHVPGLGWVGFDPANRCCPDDRYVRLGSGLDAVDAAPIRGLTDGTGEEVLDVTVQVNQAQQQ